MKKLIASCASTYNLDSIKKFNRYNIYTNSKNKIITLVSIIMFLIALVANFNEIITSILVVVPILWFLALAIIPALYSRVWFKRAKKESQFDIEGDFFENDVEIRSYNKNKETGKSVFKYNDLTKVVINKGYVYLYISKDQAFIFKISKFEGDFKKLTKIFSLNLKERYIYKK